MSEPLAAGSVAGVTPPSGAGATKGAGLGPPPEQRLPHRSLPFTFAQSQSVLLVDGSDGPLVLSQGEPSIQRVAENGWELVTK